MRQRARFTHGQHGSDALEGYGHGVPTWLESAAELDGLLPLMQELKAQLSSKAPKTVSNILAVLGKTVRLAIKWRVIGAMPCTFDLLRVSNLVPEFYEFAEYQRLAAQPFFILRHTLFSHLAMRGAPAKAIQELAGHSNLTTTYRYTHLSPAVREGAIRLLIAGTMATVLEKSWRGRAPPSER